ILMLWQRCVLFDGQALARSAYDAIAVWHGEPYLRGADGSGGGARRVPGSCRVRRCQFPHRMELENWVRPNAGCGSDHLVDRDDDLRVDAVVVIGGIQGTAASPQGITTKVSKASRLHSFEVKALSLKP